MSYIYYCLLLFNIALASKRFGPYKCVLVRVGPCKKPTLPIMKNSPILFSAETYNTTTKSNLLRGNVTVLQEVRCKKANLKAFFWEFGKWHPQYTMNNVGCNSVFLPMAIKVTQVNIDPKTCKFLKGTYIFKNFDTNEMQHVWMSTQEYGRIMWTTEFFSPSGSILCAEFETEIQPL